MFRVIVASTSDAEIRNKLVDKILDFIETQYNFARQHSFLLHEIGTKSFTRTILGNHYNFKMTKGVLTVLCNGSKIGSMNLNSGRSVKDAEKLADKVIRHANGL